VQGLYPGGSWVKGPKGARSAACAVAFVAGGCGDESDGVAHQTVRRRGRAHGRDVRLTRRAHLSVPACVRTRECTVGPHRRILTSWAEP
jgi:hypothetical protein